MTVRPLRPDDEPAVRSLQTHLAYADPDLVTAALEGPFKGLVAVVDGAVVGYAIALPGPETTLSELVVDPDHRREGHGQALVGSIAAAPAVEAVVVTTPAAERAAIRFYRALGFVVEERLPGFYADGTDVDGAEADGADTDGADALRLVRRE